MSLQVSKGKRQKKGRLFSFGFLGFSRPARNAQAAFFIGIEGNADCADEY
jgi:hypothetical protein